MSLPRSPIDKQELLKFSDFEYAQQLTKEEVISLIGNPTYTDPKQPGFAECCTWEAEYPIWVTTEEYRLRLCFGAKQNVIAGGLNRNGKWLGD